MTLLDTIRRAIEPLSLRLKLMFGHGTLDLVDDNGEMQQLQVEALRGELLRLLRIQNYGYYSHPPRGSDVVFGCLGGQRSAGMAVAAGHRQHRAKGLAEGEAMMRDWLGKHIHMRADGTLHLKAPRLVIDVDELVLLVAQRYRRDVGGLADELRKAGAAWQQESWSIGATMLPPIANDVAPPATEAP